jgi:hypothetical protein
LKKPQWSLTGLFFVFAVCAVIPAILNSCGKKDTCNVPCYSGTCVDNSCNCTTGYEGDSCTIQSTQKFIGSYTATDSCGNNEYGYTVTIAASSTITNQLIITNFGEYGTAFVVNADISGFNLTVPSQIVEGITLTGNGTLDTVVKKITVSYNAVDEFNQTIACTGVWLKQ